MYVEDSLKYSFCQTKKKVSYKSAMIIVSHQWHYKVSNPPENTVDSYFIAGFVCFIAALTNLATDLNILWKANPAVK